MEMMHKKYGLWFINGTSRRMCDPKRCNGDLALNLSWYLLYPDDIIEEVLPEVERALKGKSFEDISIEAVTVTMTADKTVINLDSRIVSLPTMDFKLILEEYTKFLLGNTMLNQFTGYIIKGIS